MKNKKINNKDLAKQYKLNYSNWKKDSLNSNGYFIIFNGFKNPNKLKSITGNALKLYIYLGLNSNNLTGEVWHSNKTIAKYFDKSERTIRYWMQELESLNLIKRFQLEFNEESHVFLQPYVNQKQLISEEKYTYKYQLKNVKFREIVDFRTYDTEISLLIKKNFPKCYVKCTKNYFEITAYKPIDNKYLRSLTKLIKSEIPSFESYVKTYTYKKSDGSIGSNNHLLERVKSKKNNN